MPLKTRADQLLVAQGLADSRSRAARLIANGLIFADARLVEKPAQLLPAETVLTVTGDACPWVSRGGVKLARALEYFQLDAAGRVALDIGASTGGFTEVLLAQGAARVYAIDVGQEQLHLKLQNDPRVVQRDKVNARNLQAADFDEPLAAIVCDASFISLKLVLPAALQLAAPGAWLVALIKPQFEVGRGGLGKGGIVKDPALHETVCVTIHNWLAGEMRWHVLGITDSPITGGDGNKEFLIAAVKR